MWTDIADEDIYLDLPFHSYREGVKVTDNTGFEWLKNSLLSTGQTFPHPDIVMGHHNFYDFDNEANFDAGEEKRTELIVSGDSTNIWRVDVEYVTCTNPTECDFLNAVIPPAGSNGDIVSCGAWSDPNTWAGFHGDVPQAGEAVTIPMGVCILIDISCS